jgi:NADH-quinone oxidoreductase subunit M
LFLVVGVLYDRLHTHEIARFNGLVDRMPLYAATFMVFMLASMGLPGTSGFVGEFLVIVGSLQVNFWLALLGGTGMILGVAYMLYLYRRVIFGRITKEDLRAILDLSPREVAVFTPLILLTLWMGIYPSSFTSFWDASVASMVQHHTAALEQKGRLAAATPSWPGLTRPSTTGSRAALQETHL